MKKIVSLPLLTLFVCIFFLSCKKNSADTTGNPGGNPDTTTIPSVTIIQAMADLSAKLKVFHGQRITGQMPATNSTALSVDPPFNNKVFAYTGRFAQIKPTVKSGSIAGYYLEVPSSGQYFKIDYSKPRNPNRQIKTTNDILLRPLTGNGDSSIVIILPGDQQTTDTICVTYAPYDAMGNIGPAVNTCIIIKNFSAGTDQNGAWIGNSWKETAVWIQSNNDRLQLDSIIFDSWRPNAEWLFACVTDTATGNSSLQHVLIDAAPAATSLLYARRRNLNLLPDGTWNSMVDEDSKFLDITNSTCSQFFYYPVTTDTLAFEGAWSFNSVSNTLTVLYEFQNGIPYFEVLTFNVIKFSDKEFLIKLSDDPHYTRYER